MKNQNYANDILCLSCCFVLDSQSTSDSRQFSTSLNFKPHFFDMQQNYLTKFLNVIEDGIMDAESLI